MIAVIVLVAKTAFDAGEFREMNYHGIEKCTLRTGFIGLEDAAVDHINKIAFFSSDNRKEWLTKDLPPPENFSGDIVFYNTTVS